MPFGLLGVVVGALLFGVLSAQAVAGLVGALTLAFLAQRLLFPPRRDAPHGVTLGRPRLRRGVGLHQLRGARRRAADWRLLCCR